MTTATTFTFDSAEAVAWLQMYVDMVKAGTVDNTVLTTKDDRVGLLLFSAGQAAVLRDRPEPRSATSSRTTPPCTSNLAIAPAPLGKSGVTGKGLMCDLGQEADTKFPNASIALAQFFTNPRSMVQFAKQVVGLPVVACGVSTIRSSPTPRRPIEDSARPLAEGIIATYAGHRPDDPEEGRRQ